MLKYPKIYVIITVRVVGSSGSSSSYDYDKGYGYTAPKSGQSFSDYVKEQDPDLYNSMVDRYNSLS